jgi:hypothetical protein
VGETCAGRDDYYIKKLKPELGMEFENEHIAYESAIYSSFCINNLASEYTRLKKNKQRV